jgi:hypothetical protein
MQDSQNVKRDLQLVLDSLGGEPLEGSGFETEPYDPDFASEEEQ